MARDTVLWLGTLAALPEHQGLIPSTPPSGIQVQFEGSQALFKHEYGAQTYKKFRQKHPYTLMFFYKEKNKRETD